MGRRRLPDGAAGLSRAGVETSGHRRAVQALGMIDTQFVAAPEGQDARRHGATVA